MDLARRLRRQASGSGGSMVLMLSLYLLLLAFFIVLTSISTVEEGKRDAVVESVVSTFEGKVSALKSLPRPKSGAGSKSGGRSLSDQIESLFKQSLPAVKMEQSSNGTVLRLEAPASALFVAGDARLSPGRDRLLKRLVEALQSDKAVGKFYELRFMHSVPQGAGMGPNRVAVLRAGVIARHLEDRGLPGKSIGTGLMPAGEGDKNRKVAFEIHLHQDQVVPEKLQLQDGGGS